MRMVVNGIEVTVTKKTIKNMHLYVKPPDGRVEVSAPLRLSDERIEAFVRSKTTKSAPNRYFVRSRFVIPLSSQQISRSINKVCHCVRVLFQPDQQRQMTAQDTGHNHGVRHDRDQAFPAGLGKGIVIL